MTNKELWFQAANLVGEPELSRRFRLWCRSLIRRELVKRSESSADELSLNEANIILEDLNKRTGRRYTLTPEAQRKVRIILNAGYTVEDFAHVHELMVKKWIDDPKMRDYLRPSTLWQLSKFDERLALWNPPAAQGKVISQPKSVKSKDDSALIAKLMAKPWYAFQSWGDFVRWTIQFPDAKALAKYPMPEKIERMRMAPQMIFRVLKGEAMPAVEDEYQRLKKEVSK